ncbi:GGDEF domain-containing protein [Fibrobacter sp. UWB4]|jgi:diguanylate cyclase (GGDEF)-like protein|uniref:GGDEF domain-containing protein n=1 Tax=Fibrobacter sp. UWB4 TaxID=1964356 RepID=UPI000B528D16|nr:GGDEF domain-containing protein [Fibrobacter sp. UWB4]OWV18460.1 GGDEF domain-containing protein [Fibrobacter sp. UWB4]
MQEVHLVEIYIADMLGLFLILGAIWSGAWKLQKKNKEDRLLLGIMLLIVCACVADAASFAVDNRPGELFRGLSYVSNFVLFFANLVIGPLWVMLVSRHIYGNVSRFQCVLMTSISGLVFALLIANFFYPVVFRISETNVYSRGPLFMVNNLMEVAFMIDGVIIYLIGRARSGGVKFFPVLQFVWPIFICVCLQNFFYGISTVWVGIAVGFTSLMLALQNENIFIDKLTRLFNRYYLDRISGTLKRSNKIAMMMIDMNGFKSINDNLGHSQGDDALFSMAEILRETVESHGTAVRYAGDEFVIVINTDNEQVAASYRDKIKQKLADFNKKRIKKYKLSASIGMGIFDLKQNNLDEILEIIDKRMYEDKKAYYEASANDRRRRR